VSYVISLSATVPGVILNKFKKSVDMGSFCRIVKNIFMKTMVCSLRHVVVRHILEADDAAHRVQQVGAGLGVQTTSDKPQTLSHVHGFELQQQPSRSRPHTGHPEGQIR
jgi:hypothetical protein